jgi:hypothetical protein
MWGKEYHAMQIPSELLFALIVSISALALAYAGKLAAQTYATWKNANPTNAYQLERNFEIGRAYGEQLMAKHGYTDKAQVEAEVLKFVNNLMVAQGFQPPARELAEAYIKALVRQHSELTNGG